MFSEAAQGDWRLGILDRNRRTVEAKVGGRAGRHIESKETKPSECKVFLTLSYNRIYLLCITHTGAGPDHFPTNTAASAATRCFFLLSFLRSSSTVLSVTVHSPMARPHAYHQSPLTRAKGALAMHPLYSAEFPVACDERSMAGGTNQQ